MGTEFVWLSYIVTYALVAGYAITIWRRARKVRDELAD